METVTVTEAAELLVKEGVLKGRYADQAVRRLIKLGELKAKKPPVNQPKLGHRILKSSLDEYIEIGTMSVSELRKELLKARRELAVLKYEDKPVPVEDVPPGQSNIDDFMEVK